jgi:hypothetical protein
VEHILEGRAENFDFIGAEIRAPEKRIDGSPPFSPSGLALATNGREPYAARGGRVESGSRPIRTIWQLVYTTRQVSPSVALQFGSRMAAAIARHSSARLRKRSAWGEPFDLMGGSCIRRERLASPLLGRGRT